MTDNVINFAKFRKKLDKDPKQEFDLTLARQVIQRDPQLRTIISALNVSEEEAAHWLVLLSQFQYEIELAVYNSLSKTSFHPAFAGLLVQALSSEASDQLTGIGMNVSVKKDVFLKFQKNAIAAILESKHIDDLMSEDFNDLDGEKND